MTETPQAAASKAPEAKIKPTVIEIIAQEEQQDKKFTRAAIAVAVVLHIFIFAFSLANLCRRIEGRDREKDQDLRGQTGQVQTTPETGTPADPETEEQKGSDPGSHAG